VLRDNVANVKRMLEMIEKVDQVAQSEIISEVIPIKFAKAEEIASALSSVGGGTGGTVGTRSSGAGVTGRTGTGTSRTGTGTSTGYNPSNPMGAPGATTPTPSSNASFGDRVRNLISKAAGSGEFSILGETKIIADIRSNSLLVFASRQDMEMIKDIISKLDVVLAQVLIETVIMDVSLGNKWELGVSAAQQQRDGTSGSTAGGFNNSNPFYNFANSATNAFPGNFTSTLPDAALSYFGTVNTGPNFDIALKAAASDNRVNVIQKPRILTSHATPASIFIGSTVPYVTGTYYGYGAGTGGSSSYQQLKVGIGLDVTPFINQDGLVVMQIQETIDEVSGFTTIENVGDVPTTTSRTLSAEVAVKHGDSIVLGGFIRNSDSKNKSGVPLLKDIPLLGVLFSSRSSDKNRTELMVLMRPTVLRTPELAAAHLEVEKERLPGVRAAERELDKVELRRADEEKKFHKSKPAAAAPAATPTAKQNAPGSFKETSPFTAEEEQLLLNPPPVTAK
jgi:general secretion pathway protein D